MEATTNKSMGTGIIFSCVGAMMAVGVLAHAMRKKTKTSSEAPKRSCNDADAELASSQRLPFSTMVDQNV